MKNVTEIAEDIIADSDGAFTIQYSEEYHALSSADRFAVDDMVYNDIQCCDACGWNFHYDSLTQTETGEQFCWRCYEDSLEDEDEEIEE